MALGACSWDQGFVEVEAHLEPQHMLWAAVWPSSWLLLTGQLVWSILLIVRNSTVKNRINGAATSSLAIYRHS